MGHGEQIVDGLMKGGLICEFVGYHMGVTAENIAEMYNISRRSRMNTHCSATREPAAPFKRVGLRMR